MEAHEDTQEDAQEDAETTAKVVALHKRLKDLPPEQAPDKPVEEIVAVRSADAQLRNVSRDPHSPQREASSAISGESAMRRVSLRFPQYTSLPLTLRLLEPCGEFAQPKEGPKAADGVSVRHAYSKSILHRFTSRNGFELWTISWTGLLRCLEI